MRWRRLGRLGAALLICLLALRFWPHAALLEDQPWSRAVTASNGELLRLALASDEQFRLPLQLDQVAPQLPEAVLLYEDRWFYWHPGVNPVALLRSALGSAAGPRRQGGSTITMQLARQLYHIDSRSISGKLWQSAAALWLEARYSKRAILQAYLNLAPYGGNLSGIGAASLVYFRKPADKLVLAESLSLAVIPQNPRARLIGGQGRQALHAARARLWTSWVARHPEDQRWSADLNLDLHAEARSSLPFLAPHTAEMLLRETAGPALVQSSIDLRLQRLMEGVIAHYLRTRQDAGIDNASALLVDTQTMQVKAAVGSADYRNAAIAGQVNGTLARRSPGSTLKPFIYGLALDQGLLHPRTVLRDAPTSFGPFSPENFDGRFVGPISVEDALIRSRNVPAVAVAAKLARPDLYDFLKLAGVSRLASREHYGLALVLGGGEVSMEELAQLYAMLANGGEWAPLVYKSGAAATPQAKRRLLSPEAAYIVLDMLRANPRPDSGVPGKPAIAWKTGTSWGFRDAWTAGVFGRYALVVWLGRFDGASNPALIGVEAAAPLFLRLADAIRAERLDPGAPARELPSELRRVDVCAASGDLPDELCPRTVPTWFIAGKSPVKRNAAHRTVWIDQRSGQAACGPGAGIQARTLEVGSSDTRHIMDEAGLPLRSAAAPPACQSTPSNEAPRIAAPIRGVVHTIRSSHPEPVQLRAEAAGDVRQLIWFVDDALVGRSAPGEALWWKPPAARRYTVRAVDPNGRADSRELQVEFVP